MISCHVDRPVSQWRVERPDVYLRHMGIIRRISRASRLHESRIEELSFGTDCTKGDSMHWLPSGSRRHFARPG